MDFIERIFGVSPDNGNGSLEAMYVALPLLAVVAYFLVRMRNRGKARSAG